MDAAFNHKKSATELFLNGKKDKYVGAPQNWMNRIISILQ